MTGLLALLPLLAACGAPVTDTGSDTGSGTAPAPLDVDEDGFSTAEGDCDDADASVFPGAPEACNERDDDCDGASDEDLERAWYPDVDADGYGDDASAPVRACAAPDGMVEDASDCNDVDPRWNPAAEESDCTDPNDYNCDGSVSWADADRDGFAACEECDDANADVFPGASEACNGRDDDCDGTADGPATPGLRTWYPDRDADGHGNPDGAVAACAAPAGHVEDATDCDDADAAFHPGAPESDCTDPNDYDCDGTVLYADADADAWAACVDCDDADADVRPDAAESCNDRDDDCDGAVDEDDAADASTWYADLDADGHGAGATALRACAAPLAYVSLDGDCDDDDPAVSPVATEVCNAVDDDCDGTSDEDDAADAALWYADADADGYGDADAARSACVQPDGYVPNAEDDDDTDDDVYPGAPVLAYAGTVEAAAAYDARLTWATGGWRAGYGLTTVDDVDGDGVDDLVVGARGTPSDPYGSVFVVSGATGGDTSLDAGRLRLQADKYTPWPAWLTALGGGYVAAATTGASASDPGAVFVLDASSTGNDALKDAAITIEATSEDAFSEASLAPWGTASGRRGLAAASPSEGLIAIWDASRLASGTRADAPVTVDLSGYMGTTAQVQVADVGDTDGDGIGELAVGLPQRQPTGSLDGYVFLVPQDLSDGSHALADVGTSMTDSGGRAGFGHLVAATGDLDGDGLDDLAAATTGTTYVLSGAAFGGGLGAATLTTIDGSGWALLGGLNLDGDDDDDLVVGMAYDDVGSLAQAGRAEVHLGPLTDGGTRDSTTAAAAFTGSTAGEGMGWALARIPDPDGDGCDRLALAGFYSGTTDAPVYLLDGCE